MDAILLMRHGRGVGEAFASVIFVANWQYAHLRHPCRGIGKACRNRGFFRRVCRLLWSPESSLSLVLCTLLEVRGTGSNFRCRLAPPRRISSRLRRDMSTGYGLLFGASGFFLRCAPLSCCAARATPCARPRNVAVDGGHRGGPTCRLYAHSSTSAPGLPRCRWQSSASNFSLLFIALRVCLPTLLLVYTAAPLCSWASLPQHSLCLC